LHQRAWSIDFIAVLKPTPSCTAQQGGGRHVAPVEDHVGSLRAVESCFLVNATEMPGALRSTKGTEIPREPASMGAVRANAVKIPAWHGYFRSPPIHRLSFRVQASLMKLPLQCAGR